MTATHFFSESLLLPLPRLMCFLICVYSAVELLRHSDGNPRRRYFGAAVVVWACVFFYRTLMPLLDPSELAPSFLAPESLVAMLFLDLVMLAYPLEIIRPGWLNLRRISLLALPAVVLSAIFVVSIYLPGNGATLRGSADFASAIGRVDVFLRLIMLPAPYVYMGLAYGCVRRASAHSPSAAGIVRFSAGWLRSYFAILFCTSLSSLLLMLWPSAVTATLYDFASAGFVVYVSMKIARHNSSESSPVTRSAGSAAGLKRGADAGTPVMPADVAADSFTSRIPEYAMAIEEWFASERPYLAQNFKLTDVAAVVPLNRTYISRVFNEGLGRSFGDYVRELRMAEACRLLVGEPELPIADIAERCGFASHSTFHRSFTSTHDGMTPGEYRAKFAPQA